MAAMDASGRLSDSVHDHALPEQFLHASYYDIERLPDKRKKETGKANHGIYPRLPEERSEEFRPVTTMDNSKQRSVNIHPLGQQPNNPNSNTSLSPTLSLTAQDEDTIHARTRSPQPETVPTAPTTSVRPHPVPNVSKPRKACFVYGNEQYSLDAKLLSLPRATKYLVKERTKISPGRFMAKLALHCAR